MNRTSRVAPSVCQSCVRVENELVLFRQSVSNSMEQMFTMLKYQQLCIDRLPIQLVDSMRQQRSVFPTQYDSSSAVPSVPTGEVEPTELFNNTAITPFQNDIEVSYPFSTPIAAIKVEQSLVNPCNSEFIVHNQLQDDPVNSSMNPSTGIQEGAGILDERGQVDNPPHQSNDQQPEYQNISEIISSQDNIRAFVRRNSHVIAKRARVRGQMITRIVNECLICAHQFNTANSTVLLRRHLRNVHLGRKYCCLVCNNHTGDRRIRLITHMKLKHPNVVEPNLWIDVVYDSSVELQDDTPIQCDISPIEANISNSAILDVDVPPTQSKLESELLNFSEIVSSPKNIVTFLRRHSQLVSLPNKVKGRMINRTIGKCLICAQQCTGISTVRQHIRNVHLGKKFTCLVCKDYFGNRRSRIVAHIQQKHPDVVDPNKWWDVIYDSSAWASNV